MNQFCHHRKGCAFLHIAGLDLIFTHITKTGLNMATMGPPNGYLLPNIVPKLLTSIPLTEMDNYFPGAFFTLVPFNPNPVNPSWIRVKTWPQT